MSAYQGFTKKSGYKRYLCLVGTLHRHIATEGTLVGAAENHQKLNYFIINRIYFFKVFFFFIFKALTTYKM